LPIPNALWLGFDLVNDATRPPRCVPRLTAAFRAQIQPEVILLESDVVLSQAIVVRLMLTVVLLPPDSSDANLLHRKAFHVFVKDGFLESPDYPITCAIPVTGRRER